MDAGIDSISCSVDGGTKELYEKIRGLSFDKTMKNLKEMASLYRQGNYDSTLSIRLIKFPGIQKEIQHFMEKWKKITADVSNVSLEEKNLSTMAQQVENASEIEFENVKIKEIQDSYEEPSFFDRILKGQVMICDRIYRGSSIHYDGNVTGCCYDMDKHLSFGNVTNTSLYEIWHGGEIEKLRNSFRNQDFDSLPSFCQNCIVGKENLLDSLIISS